MAEYLVTVPHFLNRFTDYINAYKYSYLHFYFYFQFCDSIPNVYDCVGDVS
jgi:hypothetical protein